MEEKKSSVSVLGIIALILSIIPCTYLLGIVLAIIDLLMKNGKKKIFSIIALVIGALWLLVSILFLGLGIIGSTVEPTEQTSYESIVENEPSEEVIESESPETEEPETEEVVTEEAETTEEATEKQTEESSEPDMTLGQKNALRKADDYLMILAFSYTGLIKQLEFDGFTTEEATFAADHCGADWNEQALKKADDYLSLMGFSKKGLIGQLEFDNFTTEEATYAADNCGADWNEQAARKAQDYIDLMSFSRDGLIGQLEFDGFTKEEAEYGATAVGY